MLFYDRGKTPPDEAQCRGRLETIQEQVPRVKSGEVWVGPTLDKFPNGNCS